MKEKEFFSGGHDELQLKIKLLVVAACPAKVSLAESTVLICCLCYIHSLTALYQSTSHPQGSWL